MLLFFKTMVFIKRHGMSKTNFHRVWCAMRERCNYSKNKRYKHYGGRGISVCERWDIFENFRDDMYENYIKHQKKFSKLGTQLDRINNNGNYEPNNCKWSTHLEQANNKSNNRYFIYKGEKLTTRQLANKYNLNVNTLNTRIYRDNLSIKRAIETQIK